MRVRNFLLIALAIPIGLAVVGARSKGNGVEGWSEPFEHWTREQAVQILQDSPWAKSQDVATIINTKDAGSTGEKDFFYKFTARFFSALPVREGYVRLYQLLNNYGSLDAVQKQQFNAKFKRGLDLDVSHRVIVALDFTTNDPQAERNVMDFLHAALKDTFKLNTFLVSDRLGRVDLAEYFPPSTDGTGAKFVFPRLFKGQPVVLPTDENVRLDIRIPISVFSRAGLSATPNTDVTIERGGANSVSDTVSGPTVSRQAVEQRIFLTFHVPEMFYNGRLTL